MRGSQEEKEEADGEMGGGVGERDEAGKEAEVDLDWTPT